VTNATRQQQETTSHHAPTPPRDAQREARHLGRMTNATRQQELELAS